MERHSSPPFFPYPHWTFSNQSGFSDRIRRALNEEAHQRCMFPGCEKGFPYERLECHHIVPQRLYGPGDEDNGIAFCAGHHELADRGIITPDACLRFKRKENPYLDLSSQSLDDLVDRLRSISEFSERRTVQSTEEEWRELCSVLMCARESGQRNSRLCQTICAWALSMMAGFCVSHMVGNKVGNGKSHPRHIIDTYARESDLHNAYGLRDTFLPIHNAHHRAVNLNALLAFPMAAKGIQQAQAALASLDGVVTSLIPVKLPSYGSYLTANQISILAKAGEDSCLELIARQRPTINDVPDDVAEEAWPKYLLASILLNREGDADAYAERAVAKVCRRSWIREASRFRILAAWALRKGSNHIDEAEAFIQQSEEIGTRYDLGHQLAKTKKLKGLMADPIEDLSFQKGPAGSSRLLRAAL